MTTATQRMPPQVPFIIGQEACERFSFYGMRNILTVFLIDYLLVEAVPDKDAREALGKSYFHLFVGAVYFFPLLGGFLADRFFGKFRVILWLSILYCLGHACLAAFDDVPRGFYFGLFLIALGSGGIKPCVSAMVGDQFTEANKHLAKRVFTIFYWSINLGSFFASLLIPKMLKLYGPAVAFGIPGALMLLATIIYVAGSGGFVKVPPTGPNPHSFLKVIGAALSGGWKGARAKHPEEAVDGSRAVLRVLAVFAPIPIFWMLFDQKASTWVVQAKAMDPTIGPWTFEPSQMQLVNPALVMILIPFTAGIVYPAFKAAGFELTALRKMTLGLAVGGLSYVIAGLINIPVAGGARISILWQIAPYVVLTIAEVLVSVTGLEFAYSQAPRTMKGTIMSFWSLTNAVANYTVAIIAALNVFKGTAQFFFWAVAAGLAALALGLIARRYVVRDWYQKDAPVQGEHALQKPA